MKLRWLFLLLLLGAVFFGWRKFQENPERKAAPANLPVPVVVTKVETKDVPIWITGLGTVQAFNSVTVRPRVGGILEKVAFTEGQDVKVGDVLAQIDPRPYRAALDQATAKQAQSAAQATNARNDLNRVSQLVGSGAESRGRYDELKANADQFTALEQESTAAMEAARLDLDFTTVRAPIAGRTGLRLVDEGNLVTANQSGGLVVIAQLQPITVMVSLPQQNLPALQRRIQSGAGDVIVQAMADDGSVLAEGKLALIDNQIDVESGSIRLKAVFGNEDETLWPGQFVSARVLIDMRKEATVVPTPVVQAGLDGPFAYLVKEDKTVEARNLKVGPAAEGITLIEDGLVAGDTVVLDGQSKLKPGASIAIQEPRS
jgi:multidrug efflux system membrane fusion protein